MTEIANITSVDRIRGIKIPAEAAKVNMGRVHPLRRAVAVSVVKVMGTVKVPPMRHQGAMSPGENPRTLNAGRRKVAFMPRGSALECKVGRVVAVTTVRVLPIVAREGRREVPGRCATDMTLAAGLSGQAKARGTPVDRCSVAGLKIDITKDRVARSSEAAVTTGLR